MVTVFITKYEGSEPHTVEYVESILRFSFESIECAVRFIESFKGCYDNRITDIAFEFIFNEDKEVED